MPRTFSRTARLLALVVTLLALGLYESRFRPAALERELPFRDAEWIWASGLGPEDGWVDFFAYRDFDLETVPVRADLAVQADEGYWLFVNQRAAGSGSYRDHGPVDAYDVAKFLRPGNNRILIQLRSRRGVGGLLARLDLAEGRSVVTDGDWRTSRRYETALLTSGFVAEDEGGVAVWGRPPVGSWHFGPEVARVAVLRDQLVSARPAEAVRVRALGSTAWDKSPPPADGREVLGRWVIFDFGRVMHGYVNVVFSERGASRGLLYTGLDRSVGPDRAEPATYFSSPAGRGSWTDSEPREFRFVTVLALVDIAGLRVFETAPELVAQRADGTSRSVRAFGFEPPPSGATIEDEFWRELKRVAGLTGREAFEGVLRP